MVLSLGTNYVVPAVLLNPVLLLHSVNTILSRILPAVSVDAATQPTPYSRLGPSAQHPHIDMHANDNLCWSYTMVMVCAQLVAFGRVNRKREEMRERSQSKNKGPMVDASQTNKTIIRTPVGSPDQEPNGSASEQPLPTSDLGRDRRRLRKSQSIANGHVVTPKNELEWDMVR